MVAQEPFPPGDAAIGAGRRADAAIESAGITLRTGDLQGLVRVRRLSAATMRNIRQSLFFAFIYDTAAVPIAAGVLYPGLGIPFSPILAGAAMALSLLSAIGNVLRLRAVRLLRRQPKRPRRAATGRGARNRTRPRP
jgi:Cu+-exporting ATPase